MRFVVGTDDGRPIVGRIAARLRERGHEVMSFAPAAWAKAAIDVAREVASGRADAGVVCCYTGTGVSIAANKVTGVRAALCVDAQTAAGARTYNDANVLALSLRLLSDATCDEILDAWLQTSYDGTEAESLDAISFEEGDAGEASE
jgi:ribose 5-phosphate isomerase B